MLKEVLYASVLVPYAQEENLIVYATAASDLFASFISSNPSFVNDLTDSAANACHVGYGLVRDAFADQTAFVCSIDNVI